MGKENTVPKHNGIPTSHTIQVVYDVDHLWIVRVAKMLALHALESHMCASSEPGCFTFHPLPYLWFGKVEDSPKPWDLSPSLETQ